jgi:hypothetical protein
MENNKQNPQNVLERKFPQYIIGAFSIVAALAWNDLIKDLLRYNKDNNNENENKRNNLLYKLTYALIATLIIGIVVIIVYKCNLWYYLIKNNINDKIKISKPLIFNHKNGTCKFIIINNPITLEHNKNYKQIIFECDLYNLKNDTPYTIDLLLPMDDEWVPFLEKRKSIAYLSSNENGEINTSLILNNLELNDILMLKNAKIDISEK